MLAGFLTRCVVGGFLCVSVVCSGPVGHKAQGLMVKHQFSQGHVPRAIEFNENFAQLCAEIDALKAALNTKAQVAPPGSIVAFCGTHEQTPEGWLLCDGQTKPTEKYSALEQLLRGSWGNSSDRQETFLVPDLRGYFLRGADGRDDDVDGVDPDRPRVLGSIQDDELEKHKHEVAIGFGGVKSATHPEGGGWGGNQGDPNKAWAWTKIDGGGSETRPKNVAVHYIIKY